MINETAHVHHLRPARRQEKLGSMLRDILGTNKKKVRDDAVSAIPDLGLSLSKPPVANVWLRVADQAWRGGR